MNLQFAILGILTFFPLDGYKLGKIFDKAINGFWNASLSQIYRELGVLEKKGYVTSEIQEQEDRPDKRIYFITAKGEQAFDEWLKKCPDSLNAPNRDEFALRIFFGGKLSREDLKSHIKIFLEQRKTYSREMLENKKTIQKILAEKKYIEDEKKIGMRFIARRTQLYNQALIQWAEECLNELEN